MTTEPFLNRLMHDPLFNRAGRLRGVWRFGLFAVLYLITLSMMWVTVNSLLSFLLRDNVTGATGDVLKGSWGFVVQAFVLLTCATLIGWACGRVIEGLPWRALGWTLHRGWLGDLLFGSLIGAASLVVAALIAAAFGGFSFELNTAALWPAISRTVAISCLVFGCAAAAEEALFRGYPLQTLLRSWPAWVAVVPTSILFAVVHLDNPNVARGFTIVNTTLAGVWLAVAYLRTRSLWFPLGVHWSWNWTMGALLGLPVSGITELAPSPLLRAVDRGPEWITGGGYGIEGGAACTVALLLSTAFIWRTRLVSATEELKRLTDEEIPNHPAAISIFQEDEQPTTDETERGSAHR
ncbi:MAG: CPBP family intramembrane metalloprotease [Pyrinomonadaceae bacterium]|nr:CPBP family intramembrane metalloprotease [Pyrinomonadaceae bacterium]